MFVLLNMKSVFQQFSVAIRRVTGNPCRLEEEGLCRPALTSALVIEKLPHMQMGLGYSKFMNWFCAASESMN